MKERLLALFCMVLLLSSCAAEKKSVRYNAFEAVEEKSTEEPVTKPGYIRKVFPITAWHQRNMREILRQLKFILSADGQIDVNAERTSIIVYDKPEVMEGVFNLINEID